MRTCTRIDLLSPHRRRSILYHNFKFLLLVWVQKQTLVCYWFKNFRVIYWWKIFSLGLYIYFLIYFAFLLRTLIWFQMNKVNASTVFFVFFILNSTTVFTSTLYYQNIIKANFVSFFKTLWQVRSFQNDLFLQCGVFSGIYFKENEHIVFYSNHVV